MSETLTRDMAVLDQAAASFLQTSTPASERVQNTLDSLDNLKSLIGAKKVAEAKRALQSADRDVLRAKQVEFGRAVVQTCAKHGIRLQSLPSSRRQPRSKAKTEPGAPKTEQPRAPTTQASSKDEGPASDDAKKGGGVFSLRRGTGS